MSRPASQAVLRIALALAMVSAVADWASAGQSTSKEAASAERANKLVQQLGNKEYYVRQRAQDELARMGFEAFDALNAATTNDDLEIASRAKYLLRLMRVEWTAANDPPEVKKCLRDYEFQDAPSRELKMQALAGLPNGQGIAALCRLVRFEKSLLLSKTAAVVLLGSRTATDPPSKAVIETIRKGLEGCKRPGAVWLLTWTRLGAEPDAVMDEWSKLVSSEIDLLRRSPNDTDPDVVAGLIRFQVIRLKKLGKTDEAMAAIRRLVDLERGDPETSAELLNWLIEQKAWKAVDDLAKQFTAQFNTEPGMLYLLALAYVEQGKKDLAEETAKRAFALHPGKQRNQLLQHLAIAQNLRERGQFAWAQREFEYVIKQAVDSDNNELRALAQSVYGETLHDQAQDMAAAKVLEKLVEAIDAGKVTEAELGGRRPSEIRSRMYFFFACHWEGKNDLAKQREYLDKALKADAADIDVLIACYRLPEQTPEYHAKIVNLIKKAAATTREQIVGDPEDPSPCNQFAWLIGNTEGDFDEALRYSQKSVELKPSEAGFYDTLARVYFAKGDLDNAVAQQTKAAELDPHSGLIQRQLEFFRKKREEKKP